MRLDAIVFFEHEVRSLDALTEGAASQIVLGNWKVAIEF
jgi:hypothetical protein